MRIPDQILATVAEKIRTARNTQDTEDREGVAPMSKLHEDLKAAGWTETTLADCRVGDEVVVLIAPEPHGIITEFDETHAVICSLAWDGRRPALRAPRPGPVFERGEVWWCRHNDTGKEGNLVRTAASWRGTFSEWAVSAWTDDKVTPLRKLLNADGTVPQDLPEWDPERDWPLGTIVEATLDGVRMDGVRIEYVKADSSKPLSWCDGLGDWEHSSDLHNVRILSVPGHPAPTGPSLRERLLDEGTVEAVARAAWEEPGRGPWKDRAEDTKTLARKVAQLYLATTANVLDSEGAQA